MAKVDLSGLVKPIELKAVLMWFSVIGVGIFCLSATITAIIILTVGCSPYRIPAPDMAIIKSWQETQREGGE